MSKGADIVTRGTNDNTLGVTAKNSRLTFLEGDLNFINLSKEDISTGQTLNNKLVLSRNNNSQIVIPLPTVIVSGMSSVDNISTSFDDNYNYVTLDIVNGSPLNASMAYLYFTYYSTTPLVMSGSSNDLMLFSSGITAVNAYNTVNNVTLNGNYGFRLVNYTSYNKIEYSIDIEVESTNFMLLTATFNGTNGNDLTYKTIDASSTLLNNSYCSDKETKTITMNGYFNQNTINNYLGIHFNMSDPDGYSIDGRSFKINKVSIAFNSIN